MKFIVVSFLIITAYGFFQDQNDRQLAKSLFNNFIQGFINQYDSLVFEGLDHIGAMKLAFDYWVTQIRIHNFQSFNINYDIEHDIIEISSQTLNIDLVIEDKYTVPIKIENIFISIIFQITDEVFRCKEVEFDYESVSLDVNMVLEYISKQLLSLDMIKSAIKGAEIPFRNIIIHAIRSNHSRLKQLIQQIRDQSITGDTLVTKLSEVHHTRIENGQYYINVRSVFGYESERYKNQKGDL